MLSQTEENYLKAIYKLSGLSPKAVSTKAIAGEFGIAAASVTEMLKRLSEKSLVLYEKYKGVKLSEEGLSIAKGLIRRHRLWEVFLLDKLQFSWDEVHDLAEELEHIKSEKLVNRLDAFLGHPKYDPHGGPIPDADGHIVKMQKILLSAMKVGDVGILVGVQEDSRPFLQYLDRVKLGLGAEVKLLDIFEYDNSLNILVNGEEVVVSQKVSQNLFIRCN